MRRERCVRVFFVGKACEALRVVLAPHRAREQRRVWREFGEALLHLNEQRVLLIDADVRRPKLHQVFNVSNSNDQVTLGEILKAQDGDQIADAALATLVRPTDYPGLHLLPSGSGWMNTAGLLHSPKLEVLLRRFRSEFDVILLDTAPTLNMFDARVVARLADAVILVLRLGQTTKDTALAAMRRLSEDGTHVLGLILNDWDPKRAQGHTTSYYGNQVYFSRGSADNYGGNR